MKEARACGPKGVSSRKDIGTICRDDDLEAIAADLNQRHRMRLSFLTPAEDLFGYSIALRD